MGVGDWNSESRVWGQLAAVRDVQLQPRGAKGPQLTVILYDASGLCTAKSWDLTAAQIELIVVAAAQTPPVLRVSGTIEASGAYAGELTICGITVADPAEVTEEEYLPALPADHAAIVQRLDWLIAQIRDQHLSALLAKTIGRQGNLRSAYVTATAAKKLHHAYRGGLLRHSLEVADLAVHAAYHYPELRRDLLVAAALLHDIGKLWEMGHTWQQGTYTNAGSMLGHVFLGAERIGAICRSLRFPEDLRLALTHAMLSHHDELAFGSPVRPMFAEAIALAKCDQISAELEAYFHSVKDSSPLQRTIWKGDRPYFVAPFDFGDPAGSPASLGEDPEERLMRRLGAAEATGSLFGTVRLPILGVVAAGDGIQSSSDGPEPEMHEVLAPPGGANFLLRVIGDSMEGAGILAGDLLLIRRQETARDGQIVIAHVPGSGPVVKRLAAIGTSRFLQSENTAYAPIPVTEEVQIQGIVVRLERDM